LTHPTTNSSVMWHMRSRLKYRWCYGRVFNGCGAWCQCGPANTRGCIQKFPDWPPGAITANGTALCH